MQVFPINHNYTGNISCKSQINRSFKGINDIDPHRSYVEHINYGWGGSGSTGGTHNTYKHYYNNSDGKPIDTYIEHCDYGNTYFEKGHRYQYYPDGKLKSEMEYIPEKGHSIETPKTSEYKYIEYNPDRSVFKELEYKKGAVVEVFLNSGNIAKKEVLKPGIIDNETFSTVELLYSSKHAKYPDAVLGKDYYGKITKNIKGFNLLKNIKRVFNKVNLK